MSPFSPGVPPFLGLEFSVVLSREAAAFSLRLLSPIEAQSLFFFPEVGTSPSPSEDKDISFSFFFFVY